MKPKLILCLALVLSGGLLAQADQEDAKISKARILDILNSIDSSLVKKNASAAVTNFASNAIITATVIEGQRITTMTNDTSSYRSSLEAGFKSFDNYKLQRKDVAIEISPDGKMAKSLSTLVETYHFAGNAERAVTKESGTFEVIDGKVRLITMDSKVKVMIE